MDSKLASGVMLADRYRVDEALPLADGSSTFLATDTTTNEKVVAFEVDAETATVVRKAVGISHAHLATVREVLIADFGHVMIVEHVPGSTADVFADGAPRLTRVDAVRFTLRLLDALGTLHQAGVPHGSVHPLSVVIEPLGERPSPVLTHGPGTAAAYRRPEHIAGAPPTLDDDVWAITALLYRLLTGSDPPAEGIADPKELEARGIDDAILPGTIAHSLAVDPATRNTDLRAVRRELARWLAEHAGEDIAHASTGAGKPPPLPPGQSPPVSVPTPSGPPGISRSVPAKPLPPRRMRVIGLALGGVVLGVGAAYLVFALRPAPKPPAPAVASKAAESAQPPPSAVSLGDIAVTGEETDAATGDHLSSCLAAHLPKGTFRKPPDVAWLCTEKDPRIGGERLRVELVKGAAGGAPTEAMRAFSQLGWYDMPTFVVLRAGCCTDPEPPALELPEPATGCDAMAPVLTEVGKAVISGQNYDDSLKHFGEVARCETTAKRTALFRRQSAPLAAEETAFRELVKHVRER